MKALGTISVAKCPWWHRIWTVQEVMLPSKAHFVWGPLTLSWATVTSALKVWTPWVNKGDTTIGTYGNGEGMSPRQMGTAISLGDINGLMTIVCWINDPGKGRDTPIAALIKWRDRLATDPRDNVYALTGLYTAKSLPRSSKCDYSLDVKQVFIDFTLDLIFRHDIKADLSPLTLDPWQDEIERVPGLPRWAIDMRQVPQHPSESWRVFWFCRHYEANRGLAPTGVPEYTGGRLQMPGVGVDTVELVGNGLFLPTKNTGQGQTLAVYEETPLITRKTVISWWNPFCNDENQHLPDSFRRITPTGSSQYELFCRLILGDTLGNENHRPGRYNTIKDRQDLSEYLGTGKDNGIIKQHMKHQLKNRRFFVTKKGLIGLGHLDTMCGDEVWVFHHGRVPFILRRRESSCSHGNENGEDYDFGGHCYVQGIMMGIGWALKDLERRRVCLH
ncbi:hypothetical protein PG985_007722 [Apiospora marii]|uniref:uncharacterized protein n=1 Tax=Apiospora marii TaxID=335849 RepID=UPI00312D98CD